MEFDFSDVKKTIDELVAERKRIDAEKTDVLEELATACKMNYEYTKEVLKHSKNLSSIVRLIDTRLSALEITVAHIEKGNEKWLEYVDNLQDQIDILAGELSEITTTFPIKKEN